MYVSIVIACFHTSKEVLNPKEHDAKVGKGGCFHTSKEVLNLDFPLEEGITLW